MDEVSFYGTSEVMTPQRSTTTEMVTSRQAQEVQAAMVIAKKFPRDENAAWSRVMRACQRKSLAEQAMYEYPRGGQKVTGPSIRLAEAMAQAWGNLDFGIIELEQKNGESQVMAYAWDLETNTRQTKVFSVPHVRGTKKGNIALTDPRDIYEMVANQGARRLRACILGVIPGDVIDSAISECQKTLIGNNPEPLIDRVRKGAKIFEEKFSVSVPMLEKYIGCKLEAFSENDLIRLNNVFRSLKDGMAKREDYFDIAVSADESELTDPFAEKEKKEENTKKSKKSEQTDIESAETPSEESEQMTLDGVEG